MIFIIWSTDCILCFFSLALIHIFRIWWYCCVLCLVSVLCSLNIPSELTIYLLSRCKLTKYLRFYRICTRFSIGWATVFVVDALVAAGFISQTEKWNAKEHIYSPSTAATKKVSKMCIRIEYPNLWDAKGKNTTKT